MKIRRMLLALLGEKRYLFFLSNAFQLLYPTRMLGKEYQDIYFLRKFIREGDWCIDIGAHLGYFTLRLSRLVKAHGKVFAVEPMSKFNKTLQRLLAIYRVQNVTLYRVALGGKGEFVEMGIPQVGQKKKFAHARVMESSPGLQYVESERVDNRQGDDLFKDLPRLDFIKCDVEGLEFAVFSSMMATLGTHRPILLCEFFDRGERIRLYELLQPLGYQVYRLENNLWHALDVYAEGPILSQNNYFIPAGKREQFKQLFAFASGD